MSGWRWQSFGGQLMLVTDGDGAKVVLSSEKIGRLSHLRTRDPTTGILRVLKPEDAVAHMIAATPDLLETIKLLLPEGWGDDDVMDHMPGVKAARLAIAKAEGRT